MGSIEKRIVDLEKQGYVAGDPPYLAIVDVANRTITEDYMTRDGHHLRRVVLPLDDIDEYRRQTRARTIIIDDI